ncbi:SH3 domain-containing protein [Candidatus Fokinia crypta]|uniref:Bacterial SH3 domain protein n=1 Tax=Candidatus Fokinia crypta TaxID=1920990 RepID=A0ABZ0UR73_9RICK|nr:SH3 domain-containing protein [Candidatus Fokinia cryptica]WPX98072.1 Bacterial SH3 domain protein [Candidatus Fokinia cryptica]
MMSKENGKWKIAKYVAVIFLTIIIHREKCISATAVDNAPKYGRVTNLPIPRFTSIKSSKVLMRVGAGYDYPVFKSYSCINMPVQVLDEFKQWRKVLDYEKNIGWIHESLLSSNKTAKVTSSKASLRYFPSYQFPKIGMLKNGSIVKILKRKNAWCKIAINEIKGWVEEDHLWGINKK